MAQLYYLSPALQLLIFPPHFHSSSFTSILCQSEPSKGHPCTHRQLLCDRKLPACRWCMVAAQWEGKLMERKFWQWQGRAEGQAEKEMETMEKVHTACCPRGCPTYRWAGWGSTMPAGDKRYNLVVPVFSIASYHCISCPVTLAEQNPIRDLLPI